MSDSEAWDRLTAYFDGQKKAREAALAIIAERTIGFHNMRVAEALEAAYQAGFRDAKRTEGGR